MSQPARADAGHLRHGLRGVRELARGNIAEGGVGVALFSHSFSPVGAGHTAAQVPRPSSPIAYPVLVGRHCGRFCPRLTTSSHAGVSFRSGARSRGHPMPCRWKAVDGLVRALGALRAESFALEHEHPEAPVLEEAARTIGDAAHGVGATIDAPEDEGRLMGACEAIVAARARMRSLRDAQARSREL